MNKTKFLVLFIVLIVVAGVLIPAAAPAVTNVEKLVTQGNDYAAQAAKSTGAERDEKYQQAIKRYQEVIKRYPNTVDAAQAKFQWANVEETAKGKAANKPHALVLYKELVRDYDKPISELKANYSPEEAAALKKIAGDAEGKRTALTAEIDRESSHKWQYKVMDWLVNLTGRRPAFSYWFALILITIFIKILITPLTKAQFKSMKEMQKIQPLMKELQEKYKNDQATLQSKMMELYKEHGVNPFASCLPLVIQMPILILLFQMISIYQYQFEKGTFLWIGSGLSHVWHWVVPFKGDVVWFSARNLSEPDLILVVLYLISMFISQRLTVVDPTQAEQQKMMSYMFPIMFGFLFAGFPSAFLLYWLVFNILQTAQQYLITRGGATEGGPGTTTVLPPETKPKEPSSEARVTRRSSGSRRRRR